ncbi:MAG TPA: peroxiredoxin [Verrucomicrobiales bacterium]|nr:peroxiredoxin [Verrucomicrobiales bacterium]
MIRIMPLLAAFYSSLFGLAKAGPGESVDLPAPEVAGINQDGREVRFAEVYARGPTVVFFYPKAGTPGCTAQACSLRDAFAELHKQGVHVLGVSTDGQAAQKKFRGDHKLPYDLIADPEGKILAAFGVSKVLGGLLPYSSRQCFLIKGGRVIWRDTSASTSQQADDIRRVLAGGR